MRVPCASILCPTDLSAAGDEAVALAFALAEPRGVVHLLHVDVPPLVPSPLDLPPVPAAPPPPVVWDAAEQRITAHLKRLVPEEARLRGVRHELHAECSADPVEAILRQAAALRASAIVLGTHGRTGLARVLLGSVASAVLSRAPLPVILFRPAREARGPR